MLACGVEVINNGGRTLQLIACVVVLFKCSYGTLVLYMCTRDGQNNLPLAAEDSRSQKQDFLANCRLAREVD